MGIVQATSGSGIEIMEFMPGELPAEWEDEIDFVAGDNVEEVVLYRGGSSKDEALILKGLEGAQSDVDSDA